MARKSGGFEPGSAWESTEEAPDGSEYTVYYVRPRDGFAAIRVSYATARRVGFDLGRMRRSEDE